VKDQSIGNELNFVVSLLNPVSNRNKLKHEFSHLEEQRLTKILVKNKILRKFTKELTKEAEFKRDFMVIFTKLNQLSIEQEAIQANDLKEFIRISKKLSQQNVHLLLIKSTGEFPYESSNIDCLIESDKLAITTKVLQEEDYEEYPTVREPHKFLFRKKHSPKELPLHIHTRVEWEAIEFANKENLLSRARFFLNEETGALVPSIEDSILITIAHYFFEDHEIKICDLLKLCCIAKEQKIDWDYIITQAQKLGWESALFLNLRMLNEMSKKYFGMQLFPSFSNKSVLNISSIFLKANSYGVFKIPYAISASFFIQKILKNVDYSFNEKSRQIVYVFSDVIGRKILGYDEFN